MEAVPGCNHLYRREAVYWFRRRVPKDVARAIGTSQWRLSLKTKIFEEAKRLAREKSVSTDREIAAARARNAGKVSPPLSKADAERISRAWMNDILEWDEAFRVGRAGSLQGAERWLEEEGPSSREALANYDTATVSPQVNDTLAREGLWFPPGDPSRITLAVALLKARVTLVGMMERRLGGEVVEAVPATHVPVATSSVGGTTVAQLITAYQAERVANHGEESTDRKYSHIFSALREALGEDRPVRSLNRADMREVRNLLQRVPKFATRRYPGLTLKAAAEKAEIDGGERISPSTVASYLQNLAAVFNWAVKEELLDKNPTTGLVEKAKPSIRRRGFSSAELDRLFAALAPLAKGDHPWRFWIPAMALYSGARAGELAGLRVNDIVEIDSTWCIRYSEYDERGDRIDGRTLKTDASERTVPIHSAVLEAGLTSYIASLSPGTEMLFPTLPPGPDGKPSHYLSKWFGTFRREIGIDSSATVLHSFRHGFKDACRDASLLPEIQDALGGWTTQGVSTHYGNKQRIALLKRELAKVSFAPFTLPRVLPVSA